MRGDRYRHHAAGAVHKVNQAPEAKLGFFGHSVTEFDHTTSVAVSMHHHVRYIETQTQLASNPVTRGT
jgi:hypothetical protein